MAGLPQADVVILPGAGHLFFNERPEAIELVADASDGSS